MKTADGMFRDLGVEKEVETGMCRVYLRRNEDGDERIEVKSSMDDAYVEAFLDGDTTGLFGKEILACAKLIQEMGE